MGKIREQLNQHYIDKKISPVSVNDGFKKRFEDFQCPNKFGCRKACTDIKADANFSPPTDCTIPISAAHPLSWEERSYHKSGEDTGAFIPRIAIISLSQPTPDAPPQESTHSSQEGDKKQGGKEQNPLNPHWEETLAMMRSFLHVFLGSTRQDLLPPPIRFWEDCRREDVQNCFLHLRTARCCSDAAGSGQEPDEVYQNCSPFLEEELRIINPDIIVTQGVKAVDGIWRIIGETLGHDSTPGEDHIDRKNIPNVPKEVLERGVVMTKVICKHVLGKNLYWLPTYFPSRRGHYWDWQAGYKSDREWDQSGAMRKHLIAYAEDMKAFLKNEGCWGVKTPDATTAPRK